jgi:hypothetical protein
MPQLCISPPAPGRSRKDDDLTIRTIGISDLGTARPSPAQKQTLIDQLQPYISHLPQPPLASSPLSLQPCRPSTRLAGIAVEYEDTDRSWVSLVHCRRHFDLVVYRGEGNRSYQSMGGLRARLNFLGRVRSGIKISIVDTVLVVFPTDTTMLR